MTTRQNCASSRTNCKIRSGLTKVLRRLASILAASATVLLSSAAHADTYKSMSGWLAFDYPAGWELDDKQSNTRTRYVENVMLQPRGQDFAARPGQMLVNVFDPFFVLEESGVFDSGNHEVVFRAFVRSMPGENNPSFSTVLLNGVSTFVAHSPSGEVATAYLGRVDPDGHLLVVGAAVGGQLTADTDTYLASFLSTVRFTPNSSASPGGAKAVADWYAAVGRGDREAMRALSCSSPRLLTDLVGGVTGRDFQEMMDNIFLATGKSTDFSRLKIYTTQANANVAIIRIAGLERRMDGAIVSFPSTVGPYGSNLIAVDKENGVWKVCEPIQAGR